MPQSAESGKRIALFDNLKFILISLVVIGHFCDQLTSGSPLCKALFLFIYSFHMPMFIYISGLFHNYKNTFQKVIKYLFICALLCIFIFAVRRFLLGENTDLQYLEFKGIPWFMFALAVYEAVSCIVRKINKKFLIAAAFIIALFAGYDKSIGDFMALSRIAVYFPFFLLGTVTPKEKLIAVNESKMQKIIGAVILIAAFVLCCVFCNKLYVLRPYFTGRNPYSGQFAESGILIRALCYFIAAVMSYSILAVIPKKEIKGITRIGRNTLQIYFWHRPFLYIFVYFGYHKFCSESRAGMVLYFLTAALLIWILSLKIFSFPTKTIMNADLLKEDIKE